MKCGKIDVTKKVVYIIANLIETNTRTVNQKKVYCFFPKVLKENFWNVLNILIMAVGAGLGTWGVINLMEGYGNDRVIIMGMLLDIVF